MPQNGAPARIHVFAIGWKTLILALSFLIGAQAQDAPRRFQIGIGQSHDQITAICGKPFEKSREDASGVNASIGVPLGFWNVFHLTPFEDRMYVTLTHFDASDRVDAIMLTPTGDLSVEQILRDHPLLGVLCADGCETIQIPVEKGDVSLLLKPRSAQSGSRVIYFMGDGASRFHSVDSMKSFVSWVYVIRLGDFEKNHPGATGKTIGSWSPPR